MTLNATLPVPEPRRPPSPQRVLVFLLVTSLTLLVMISHFIAVPQTIRQQGGNKLNQAAMTIVSKVVLLTTWKPAEQVGSMLRQQQDRVLSVYTDRIKDLEEEIKRPRPASSSTATPPVVADDRLSHGDAASIVESGDESVDVLRQHERACRESLAVMQVALGARDEAVQTVHTLEEGSPQGKAAAQALRDAFGLSASASKDGAAAPPPASLGLLPKSRIESDSAALSDLAGSWQYQYATAALVRRLEGGAARAEEITAGLQSDAQHVAFQFMLIVAGFVLNFIAGIVVLLIWLIKGREWNVRAVPIEFEDPGTENEFDPLAGWSMLLAFQAVSLVVGLVVRSIVQNSGPVAAFGSVQLVIGVQLIIYALMIGIIAVAIRGRWASIGLHLRHLPRSIALGICLFWGAFVIILAVGAVMSRFTHGSNAQNNPVFHVIEEASSGGLQTLAMMALVAMLGPIFEETLFRGVIYTSMRRVMPARFAIPLNGLVFSAVHGDLNTLLPLAVLGMLLAYAYERTRSLATSSVCHCLWNGQTFLVFITLFS